MTDPLVLVDVEAPIARLTLNRPDRHNSLIPELLRDLLDGLRRIGSNDAIDVVLLAANGRTFSTGGDVGAFYDHRADLAEYATEVVGLLNETMLTMMRLPQPVIAAVHGMVTGGSLGLVLGSDVVLVSPEASFTPWYSVVGFSPDGGWTAILPDLVGRARVTDVLLNNRTISAEQAVEWGLAAALVPSAELPDRAEDIANDLIGARTRVVKRALHSNLELVAEGLERERQAFVAQVVTEESLNGMAAFLGKPLL